MSHSYPLLGKMKTHCSRLSLDWTIYISVLLGKWPNIECNSDIMCRYFNRKCFLGSRCSRSTTSCWLFAKIHCSCGCVISDSSLSMGILRCRDSQGNIELEFLTSRSTEDQGFTGHQESTGFSSYKGLDSSWDLDLKHFLGIHWAFTKSYSNHQSEMRKSTIVWISWWQTYKN